MTAYPNLLRHRQFRNWQPCGYHDTPYLQHGLPLQKAFSRAIFRRGKRRAQTPTELQSRLPTPAMHTIATSDHETPDTLSYTDEEASPRLWYGSGSTTAGACRAVINPSHRLHNLRCTNQSETPIHRRTASRPAAAHRSRPKRPRRIRAHTPLLRPPTPLPTPRLNHTCRAHLTFTLRADIRSGRLVHRPLVHGPRPRPLSAVLCNLAGSRQHEGDWPPSPPPPLLRHSPT